MEWQNKYVGNGYGGNSLGQWQALAAKVGTAYTQKRLIPRLIGKKKKAKGGGGFVAGGIPWLPILLVGGVAVFFLARK